MEIVRQRACSPGAHPHVDHALEIPVSSASGKVRQKNAGVTPEFVHFPTSKSRRVTAQVGVRAMMIRGEPLFRGTGGPAGIQ